MTTPTGFLALSGEIRNQVYEYILEDLANTPAPKYTLRHLSCSRSKKFEADKQRFRPYLGFTQVCHLIRVEFGPLYSWHKPTVPFLDAPAYLEQYPLPDREKSQQIARILRDLGTPVKMTDKTQIDILPLLKCGYTSLPFFLSFPSDIAKTRSHDRKRIVDFAIYWASVDEPRNQDRSWVDKVVKIGMRQSGQLQKVAATVEVVIVLDREAMDKLTGYDFMTFVRDVQPNTPSYGHTRMDIMVGSKTFKRYAKRRALRDVMVGF